MKTKLISLMPIFTIVLYPICFLYMSNIEEVRLSETISVVIVFALTAILIFGLGFLWTKSYPKVIFQTAIFLLVFTNFTLIEKVLKLVFPFLKYWHTLPLLLFLLVHLFYWIVKYLKENAVIECNRIIGYVMAGLIVVNVAMGTPQIAIKVQNQFKELSNSGSPTVISEEDRATDRPNIYFFVFDEYSGFDAIKEVYDYDNKDFAQFLQNHHFSVSYSSYNESFDTTTVLTNLFNLDYLVVNNTSVDVKKDLRVNAKSFEILEEAGYRIEGLGETLSAFGIPSVLGDDEVKAQTASGADFAYLALKQTMLYPFIKIPSSEIGAKILDNFAYFDNELNYTQNSGRFLLTYLLTPHPPFVFDKNGNTVSEVNFENQKDKHFYLEQFQFITEKIEQLMAAVIANDPNAIIILQSDHSSRRNYYLGNSLDSEESIAIAKTCKNHLNAVYYQGKDFGSIEGYTGMNSFAAVINKLLSLNIPLREVP